MTTSVATELIDRVDEHDRVIGTVERADALALGANFRTAHVFVFDEAERLLLQRLADGRTRHPGRWGSSVAAYVRSGESYKEAAGRRMQDELCMAVPIKLSGKIEMTDEQSRKFVALFVARTDTAEICAPDHIEELAFWKMGDLKATVATEPDRFTPTLTRLLASFSV